MMINKRLIGLVPESKQHIGRNVLFQWLSLAANIALMLTFTRLLSRLYSGTAAAGDFGFTILMAAVVIAVRFFLIRAAANESFYASRAVKSRLRRMIYEKLLRLGSSYQQELATSEVVQVAVEGVDQLETYFGSYLPQFFYSMLAPVTLFAVLSFVNLPAALVLLVCVPLIPITIAGVQTFAKKLLSKYWGEYTALGDTFLENLQGLTTLKIYQTDGLRQQQMNKESENFRRITMKVLTMQLNSITVMDVIAYGGAALGLITAALQFKAGNVSLGGGLAIILLAAEFFIPMRMLGSFFHIAMNGMAASDKIFRLLDLPDPENAGQQEFPASADIVCRDLHFGYTAEREILHGIDLDFPAGSFTAIVGESGCGKSTTASILMGRSTGFTGSVTVGGAPLSQIREDSLLNNITYIGFDSPLFKGTVEDNLRMAAPDASEEQLWQALEKVRLAEFLKSEQGLATPILERGSNFSGGQRQRLALARAILHDSPVYLFDEATSNVDADSENDIMEVIHSLARTKTVILITHRLANAIGSDRIYAMESGNVAQCGTHEELIAQQGPYADLWKTQSSLEQHREEENA